MGHPGRRPGLILGVGLEVGQELDRRGDDLPAVGGDEAGLEDGGADQLPLVSQELLLEPVEEIQHLAPIERRGIPRALAQQALDLERTRETDGPEDRSGDGGDHVAEHGTLARAGGGRTWRGSGAHRVPIWRWCASMRPYFSRIFPSSPLAFIWSSAWSTAWHKAASSRRRTMT